MNNSGKFYPYGRQNIDDLDIAEVLAALKNDYLTCGPLVDEFERKIAETVGAQYAVAVSNGTAALHIAYAATGLTKGDTIVTTPLSFAATANAALYCGAKPIFADIRRDGNLNPLNVAASISPSTRIIVPVHYAGQPADMKAFHETTDRNNIFIIEDACHALGGTYDGAPIGSCKYSDMTVFSFHPVKHITTGEGGAISTNSKELYERLKVLRSHGIITLEQNWKKEMTTLGYNYRITDIQCALGLSQLKKLKKFLSERRRIAALYDSLLKNHRHFSQMPVYEKGHAYHLYPVLLKAGIDRDKFMQKAYDAGIGLQIHYGLIYNHKYYQQNGYSGIELPVAEEISSRVVSLPMYPGLTETDIQYIVEVCNAL